MNKQFQNRQLPLGNPLANLFVIVVGALAVGASVVLGFFAFITLGALVLILAAVIGIRLWWLNRKLRKQFASGASERGSKTAGIEIIEGEYHVVSTRERNGSKPES